MSTWGTVYDLERDRATGNDPESLRREIQRLRTYAKAASDALLKVRPLGGSELFTKVGEDFYADPKFCGDCIDKLRDDLHQAQIASVKAKL